VMLDRLMAGFFTSEPVLEVVKIVLGTLRCLTSAGSYASRTLGSSDQNVLVADAAYIARLICITALQRSRPSGPYDEGDDELKTAVLDSIAKNLRQILHTPVVGATSGRRDGSGASLGYSYTPPANGTRSHFLWQSVSLARCSNAPVLCSYTDLPNIKQPDRSFVVALMAELHIFLLDGGMTVREKTIIIVVSLLQQRRGFMSELLIADIPRSDYGTETIDLMNRGEFGALLEGHEAATISESDKNNLYRRDISPPGPDSYTLFFIGLN